MLLSLKKSLQMDSTIQTTGTKLLSTKDDLLQTKVELKDDIRTLEEKSEAAVLS